MNLKALSLMIGALTVASVGFANVNDSHDAANTTNSSYEPIRGSTGSTGAETGIRNGTQSGTTSLPAKPGMNRHMRRSASASSTMGSTAPNAMGSDTTSNTSVNNSSPAVTNTTTNTTTQTTATGTSNGIGANGQAGRDADIRSREALHGAADESKTIPGYVAQANMNLKEGVNYLVLNFPKNSSNLSAAQKRQLKALADANKGNIDEIHVAVWSDRAFPRDGKTDLPKAQQDLADKRIDTIKKYLDDDLNLNGIETYSMAEGSNWFSRAFNTDEGELKSLFSQQGAPASIDASEFKVVRTKGGPMKAVLLIEREGENNRSAAPAM